MSKPTVEVLKINREITMKIGEIAFVWLPTSLDELRLLL